MNNPCPLCECDALSCECTSDACRSPSVTHTILRELWHLRHAVVFLLEHTNDTVLTDEYFVTHHKNDIQWIRKTIRRIAAIHANPDSIVVDDETITPTILPSTSTFINYALVNLRQQCREIHSTYTLRTIAKDAYIAAEISRMVETASIIARIV